MNRPDKAGEPSMEEILASIRQIIADEPETDTPASQPSASSASANVSASAISVSKAPDAAGDRNGSTAAGATDAGPGLLIDRLNGVLKNPQTSTSPFGSKRPLPFDQDLADILDDAGANGSATLAPKPAIRGPELGVPASKPFVPIEAPAKPAVEGASALPPQPAPSAPLVPPPPFGGTSTNGRAVDTAAPPPPRSFGFPPLRKQGFFPPQAPAAAPSSTAERPLAEGTGEVASSAGSAAVETSAGPKPLSETGSAGSATIGAATSPSFSPFGLPSRPAQAAPQPSEANPGGATPTASLTPAVEAAVGAVRAADAAAAEARLAAAPVAKAAAPAPAVADKSADARPPMGEARRTEESPAAQAPRFAATSDAAAAQALDALAEGLAASAASQVLSGSASPIALTPLPAPVSAPTRSLEDAVADMLRPMLQQWVADNMPRIIERALRVEVAKTVKPGSNSSGS